jgi:hypothetical protein
MPTVETPEIFTDLDGYAWAKPSILKLYDKGIVSGLADRIFSPDGKTTREQFVKMYVALIGAEAEEAEEGIFSDVDANAWYAPYLQTAKQLGITEGMPDGSFGVGSNISRQDAMVMLARGLEAKGIALTKTRDISFIDEDDVADYAKEAVKTMSEAGIISGDDTGAFRPNDVCSRAEAAVIFAKVSDLI